MTSDTGVDSWSRHLDALIERLGENRVGSARTMTGRHFPLRSARSPAVRCCSRPYAHGYDEALLKRIGSENWLAALGRIWGA